jgi:signal transduction histidine kinase
VVNDFGGETRFTPALSDSTVGGVSVVIPGMEGPFGVLAVVSRDGQAFSKDALDFMQLVGNVLAARVQREASESKVSEVAQSERTRMARDLHDEAAQDLNYALWKARGMLATSTEPDQGSALDQLILALDRAQQQVRRAIYDLRLPEEEEGPLLGPMKSLIALHRRMTPGRDIRLEVLHDAILSRPFGGAGTELLRIVSEALTNARMHSQSGSIVVRVAPSARGLRAEVTDDGRGFDPAQEPLAPGLGIKGMVDRARVLDAELTIRSAPGGGTRVILDMPLKHRPDEP